ncbi:GntR family transcriptional regulator [Bacillus sp. IB182487]|uniref:GntR family transcriptional regulator n=1 Tax=Metabacillus arenae TaxID=2771434 RepID=A0A926NKB7_9BACI|nr:GntR family transcriptional regulator [Metabacillus arenae]
MFESLLSKRGLILQKIAEELLFIEMNDRIPSVGKFSEKFNVGRGTVQTALKYLEKSGCIKLEARGHLGTFLRMKEIPQLFKYCGAERLTGVMPLPYSKKYEGLASGLTSEFEKNHLNLSIAFMRGAKLRLEEVSKGRYDFALVSKFSAAEAVKQDPQLSIALSFGKNSYVSKHAIFFSDKGKNEINNGMKVGIDNFSTDQKILLNAEVNKKEVEFVELNYMHLLQHLRAKTIDATIWNIDEVDCEMYHTRPLTSEIAKKEEAKIGEAVCVIRKENIKTEFILQHLVLNEITKIQALVEKGVFIPKY